LSAGQAGSDPNAFGDPNPYSHDYADTIGNADTQCDPHSECASNPHSECASDPFNNTDLDPDSIGYAHTFCDADSDDDSQYNTNTERDIDADSVSYPRIPGNCRW